MPDYHKGGAGKAIAPEVQARAAELVGMGLSQREAAGACGISEKSVERILRKPEYRKLADDVRRKRTSVTAQASAVVQDLLTAVKHDGEPDMSARQRGAELVMKNPALLEAVEDLDGDDSMLPGVVLRFPWDGLQNPRAEASAPAAEGEAAPGLESENGTALEPAWFHDPALDSHTKSPEPLDTPSPETPRLRAVEPLLEGDSMPPADLDLDAPLFTEADFTGAE